MRELTVTIGIKTGRTRMPAIGASVNVVGILALAERVKGVLILLYAPGAGFYKRLLQASLI